MVLKVNAADLDFILRQIKIAEAHSAGTPLTEIYVDAAGNVEVLTGTEVVGGEGEGKLERLTLRDASGATSSVEADALFVLIGARPGTAWLPPEIERDEWGYLLTGRDVPEERQGPEERQMHETSLPGVFAVGDVRHGAVKRVASAVGEGAMAIKLVHQVLSGG